MKRTIHTVLKRTLVFAALIATSIGAWADNVAKIGDTEYATLQAAVAAASTGSTIVLTADIDINTTDDRVQFYKAITLDMAGHTLTSSIGECLYVWNGGDLTITGNGTITGPTGEAGKALDGFAVITVNGNATVEGEKAKLTFLNGTLTSGGVGSDGMYGVYVLYGASATFGSEADHTGPSITSWFAAVGTNNTTAPVEVKFHGGTYTALAAPTGSEWWYYFCAPVYAAAAGEFAISGGTFEGYYAISSPYSNVAQTLDITGGTFTGTKQALFVDNQTGVDSGSEVSRDVEVSGGTFSSEVPAEYCSEDFIPQDLGGGQYGVIYVLNMTDDTNLTELNGKQVTATYTRATGMVGAGSTTGTKYGTICLPFSITVQPANMKLYKATNIASSTLTITEVEAGSYPVAAGTPLIFELTSAATTMSITSSNATVNTATPATSPATSNILVGTFTAQTKDSGLEKIYYLNGDKFHQAKKSLTVPAYRAYLVDENANEVKAEWLSISTGDDDETSISSMEMNQNAVVGVYDLNGRKQNNLQRGVNIIRHADGSTIKVIVK